MAETDFPPAKKAKFAAGGFVIPKLPNEKLSLLRKAMEALDDNIVFCFNLLKMTNNNAEMCAPFRNCFVKIERSSDASQPTAERRIVYNFAGVFEKGFNILKLYLENPAKVPENKEVRLALFRLTQTLQRIEDIGKDLAKKMRLTETKGGNSWCICLVHHLLKELSVNKQYRVDQFKDDACCSEPVEHEGGFGKYDDCSFGNPDVWHGNVDILMGASPTVAVYAKDEDPYNSERDESLPAFGVEERTQIIAQAIVFALLQKKCNPSFENYLIPTVGISKNDILFYMYDAEHDILLESPPFDLFECNGNSLSYPTVLALWFILNYKTFCTGITEAMKERNFTADFYACVNSEIQTIYKEHLRFGNCATGSQRSFYFKPIPGNGWQVEKSRPFKSSLSCFKSA